MRIKLDKLIFVTATLVVYIAFPVYRYYVLGSWLVYKIITDKPIRKTTE